MATKNAPFKVQASTKSLLDSPAFQGVSAWALIHDGKNAGKVLWTIGKGGQWKCSIVIFNQFITGLGIIENYEPYPDGQPDNVAFNTFVVGTAGGGGYDKRSASFADCLDRNGIKTNTSLSGRGTGAITDYLTGMGFTVVEVI